MKTLYLLIFLMATCYLGYSTNSMEPKSPCELVQNIPGETTCGYLEVPEDHDRPLSRKIQIAYVVLMALEKNPINYPLIYFSGGPGSVSLHSDNLNYWAQSPYRQNRDIILFDQRGINLSSAIPNMEHDLFTVLAADAAIHEEQAAIGRVIAAHKQQCLEQEIDLAKYNSFQNARDVGALMDQLAYPKYNLMGASYGTRLARVVQDMFPLKINSVVLNSPNPMSEDFLVSRLKSYALALDRVFNYCRLNNNCNASYPNLEQNYIAAINGLKDQSLMVALEDQDVKFYVNAQDAIYLIRRALYQTDSREKVPALILSFLNREPEKIKDIIGVEINLMNHYNSSMWLSVERYEMFDERYTAVVIDSIYQTLELFPEKLGLFTSFYLEGHYWHDSVLPSREKSFKPSHIPTMIFVNRYDPVTPPEHGIIMKKNLSNARLFIMDEGGHGGGDFICIDQVVLSFMDDPHGDLDTGCLNLYQPEK